MNRASNDARFTAGQLRYDFASPPSGAAECEECRGKGAMPDPEDGFPIECVHCAGAGWINDAGFPVFCGE